MNNISVIRKRPKLLDKAHLKEIAFAEEVADKGFDVVVKGKRVKGAGLLINGEEFELKTLEALIQQFTIIHRGHELRILPEAFIDSVDPEGQLAYMDSAQEVLDTKILSQPDDREDAKAVPKDVEKRLKVKMKRSIKKV